MSGWTKFRDNFLVPVGVPLAASVAAPYFFPETFSGGGILGTIGDIGKGIGSTAGINYPEVAAATAPAATGVTQNATTQALTDLTKETVKNTAPVTKSAWASPAVIAAGMQTVGALGSNLAALDAQKDREAEDKRRYEEEKKYRDRKDYINLQLQAIQMRMKAIEGGEAAANKRLAAESQALSQMQQNVLQSAANNQSGFGNMISSYGGIYR